MFIFNTKYFNATVEKQNKNEKMCERGLNLSNETWKSYKKTLINTDHGHNKVGRQCEMPKVWDSEEWKKFQRSRYKF